MASSFSIPTNLSREVVVVVILLLVMFSAISNGSSSSSVIVAEAPPKQREFDYFLLSYRRPNTLCQATQNCCPSNACCQSSALTEFTIHGLWTNYNDGTWPACCTDSKFDLKKVKTLVHALKKYWPFLSCDLETNCHGGKGLFWAHEWEKHGTCAFPVIRDEYNYFLTTINLYLKYNITKVLNEAGYVPSNSENYPLGGIVSAIQNAFHVTPSFLCSGGALEELRLCFCKDFKLRNCDTESTNQSNTTTLSEKSNCPKYISLPIYVPSGLENGEIVIPSVSQIKSF